MRIGLTLQDSELCRAPSAKRGATRLPRDKHLALHARWGLTTPRRGNHQHRSASSAVRASSALHSVQRPSHSAISAGQASTVTRLRKSQWAPAQETDARTAMRDRMETRVAKPHSRPLARPAPRAATKLQRAKHLAPLAWLGLTTPRLGNRLRQNASNAVKANTARRREARQSRNAIAAARAGTATRPHKPSPPRAPTASSANTRQRVAARRARHVMAVKRRPPGSPHVALAIPARSSTVTSASSVRLAHTLALELRRA